MEFGSDSIDINGRIEIEVSAELSIRPFQADITHFIPVNRLPFFSTDLQKTFLNYNLQIFGMDTRYICFDHNFIGIFAKINAGGPLAIGIQESLGNTFRKIVDELTDVVLQLNQL